MKTSSTPSKPPRESFSGSDSRKLSLLDPVALLQIQSLQLRAKIIADGFQSGLHRSRMHGFSVEFDEYRPYVVGDDPRTLDWRLYARSDRYCVKKYQDETNRRCFIMLDRSRSMSYGSVGYTKLEYAQTVAASLSQYLWNQRDAVGLVAFDEAVREVIPARRRHGQLQRIFTTLEADPSGSATRVDLPLRQIAESISSRGLVVLISDFLTPIDQLEVPLSLVCARGQEVCCIRILDPSELNFQPTEPITLRDAESDEVIYIEPADAAKQYAEKFNAHRNALTSVTDSQGVELLEWTIDRPFAELMTGWLSAHERGGSRLVRRSRSNGGGIR
jgi:uncharacterized protein (DUF58 family)